MYEALISHSLFLLLVLVPPTSMSSQFSLGIPIEMHVRKWNCIMLQKTKKRREILLTNKQQPLKKLLIDIFSYISVHHICPFIRFLYATSVIKQYEEDERSQSQPSRIYSTIVFFLSRSFLHCELLIPVQQKKTSSFHV